MNNIQGNYTYLQKSPAKTTLQGRYMTKPEITDNHLKNIDSDGIVLKNKDNALIANNVLENIGGTGIDINGSSYTRIIGNVIDGAKKGIVLSGPDPLITQLGLPDGTDIQKLHELIDLLKTTPEENRDKTIKSSFLSDFLSSSAAGLTVEVIKSLILIAGPFLPK